MHRAYRVGLGSAWFIVACGSAAIGQTSTAPSVDLTGKWSLTVQTDDGLQSRTLDVTMARDGTLSGSVESSLGTVAISSGRVSGDSIHFELRMAGGEIRVDFDLIVRRDTLRGTFRQDQWTGEVQGVRAGVRVGHHPSNAFGAGMMVSDSDPVLDNEAPQVFGRRGVRGEEALQSDLRDRHVHRRPEDSRRANEGEQAVRRVELQRHEHAALALPV